VSPTRRNRFVRFWTALVCATIVVTGGACGALAPPTPGTAPLQVLPGQASGIFTPAHSTFGSAVNEFFSVRAKPVQPIEFPHYRHVELGKNGPELKCTEACHEGTLKGPVAGLPSVNTCMGCHASVATDKPRIQQITAMSDKGIDLAWQRVFGYAPQSHVKFNHAPHIRANVECATCHGDIAHQTVAERNVDLHMGVCVTCHREKKAPNECVTCHF
jgi:hypothetical protein